MPLPNHPHRQFIAQHLQMWADDGGSLGALLPITSAENDTGEPPWLALCKWLAVPDMLGKHRLFNDSDHLRLEQLRAVLWGEKAKGACEISHRLFPQDDYLPRVPRETAMRAIAVAKCAREVMGGTTERIQGWNNPAELNSLESMLLQRHWCRLDGLLTEVGASRLNLLLVDDRAPKDERGRLCCLRLWKVDLSQMSDWADWHGMVVRAPAAVLLTLKSPGAEGALPNDAFESALCKVQTILRASLSPPNENGMGAWAMAWSLQPVAMVHDQAGGQKMTQPWGLDAVTGGSAALPFALGALHLFRNELRTNPAEHFLPLREQLRAIDPRRLAMSASLADKLPDNAHPLDWPLEPILDLGDKLSAFVQADQKQPQGDTRTRLALVADGQARGVNALQREEAKTLREAVYKAASHAQAPLPAAVQSVLNYLLGQAQLLQGALASNTPLSPPLNSEQLHHLRNAAPASDWPPGEHRAIQWHLLQRYARWAGGEHLLWGEPAQLASDFAPIELLPEARPTSGRDKGEGNYPRQERKTATGLYDLLHQPAGGPDHDSFFQPRLWVLSATPAAGKTTLLAEFEMHMAWRALCHYASNATEHFGEVALWVPARSLVLRHDKQGSLQPLQQALGEWVQRHHPELGAWPDLLQSRRFKVRLLLDGVNELDCASHERQALLGRWLDQDYPEGHRHLPPLLTVRTLEGGFVINGARRATLMPWNEGQRLHYIRQRLRDHPEQLSAMRDAVQKDADSAQGDATRMLYSSPGMLALGCTLTVENLLPAHTLDAAAGQTVNRARLLATYVWSMLRREWQKPHLPKSLFGPDELSRLHRLEHELQSGCWAPPEVPGPLLAALRAQALAMQPQVQLPQGEWFKEESADKHDALLQAAEHLSLVEQVDGGVDMRGRKRIEHRWHHQLLMEWFAAYGLGPGDLPPEAAAPEMKPVETMYDNWQEARRQWRAELGKKQELEKFRLPTASVCDLEETIKLAVQLRGDLEDWVSRLIKVGNAPLAARIALENWVAFGEPLYPHDDPLGPWRAQRKEGSKEGTHPVLNDLRQALHERMYGEKIHLAQRIEAGDLLGALGGSPLFEICGQALILKDEHWMPIGHPGKLYTFEMGDLDGGKKNERTTEGQLLSVSLQPFHMAGYLVTNAQYHCFVKSGVFGDAAWWPGDAGAWRALMQEHNIDPGSRLQTLAVSKGLEPVTVNFWLAQAYALWEQAERAKRSSGHRLTLPTEAQWEGAARWCHHQTHKPGKARSSSQRWRFAHTLGEPLHVPGKLDAEANETGFADLMPWDFNHNHLIGWRNSPVGIFLRSQASHGGRALHDMAGNALEWCASAEANTTGQRFLGSQVDRVATGDERRGMRGGSLFSHTNDCKIGSRHGLVPGLNFNEGFGSFRLVLVVA